MKTSRLPASGMIPQDLSMHGRLISGKKCNPFFHLDIQYVIEEEVPSPLKKPVCLACSLLLC